ncbi:Uncharacterized protein APZ42_012292 [Daphnia magna]|uniref:Uncharacterized protein n=1 Tax=Daphnia magna TaxID=35525 RepID=A0A162RZF0_9CRUS|nr:Uncharacterized protein APZ42_012292 [Daphnia magna]
MKFRLEESKILSLFSKTPESEMEVETKSYFKHAVEWARERLKTFGISEPCGSGPSVQNYCHDDVHCQKNCDMLLLDHSREALPLDISSKSNNVKCHKRSSDHSQAIYTFVNRCKPQAKIDADLIRQERIDQDYSRESLNWAVDITKFLSSRGLAYRGFSQQLLLAPNLYLYNFYMQLYIPSHFYDMNIVLCHSYHYIHILSFLAVLLVQAVYRLLQGKLLALHDAFLAKHLATYGNNCKCGILIVEELKEAKYYPVIVYSTSDTSHTTQLFFVLLYVLLDEALVERFLVFLPMHGGNAIQMFDLVTDMLNRLGILKEDLRGQS